MSIHERNDKQPQEGGEHSSSASRAAAERHDVMRRVGRVEHVLRSENALR
jgi:hypothetical protein